MWGFFRNVANGLMRLDGSMGTTPLDLKGDEKSFVVSRRGTGFIASARASTSSENGFAACTWHE